MRTRISPLVVALILLSSVSRAALAHLTHGHHPIPSLLVTGYDDRGWTASGTQARYGECAVDPRYIPLGSYVHIPGIGDCHAEDTGGEVIGWHVDVWRPTVAQCYALTGYYRGASWYRR